MNMYRVSFVNENNQPIGEMFIMAKSLERATSIVPPIDNGEILSIEKVRAPILIDNEEQTPLADVGIKSTAEEK